MCLFEYRRTLRPNTVLASFKKESTSDAKMWEKVLTTTTATFLKIAQKQYGILERGSNEFNENRE